MSNQGAAATGSGINAGPGGDMVTTSLPGREGESIQVTTGPGRYAVDRSYNPDPSLSEQERAAGRQEGGELPGGGHYSLSEHVSHHTMQQVMPSVAGAGGMGAVRLEEPAEREQ